MQINVNDGLPVIVVGAGLAGLTCAHELERLGHSVRVIEARERPGGRVHTAFVRGSPEEFGGKVLNDGGDYETIRELIKLFNLQIQDNPAITSQHKVKGGEILSRAIFIKNGPAPDPEVLKRCMENASDLGCALDRFFAGHAELREMIEDRVRGFEGLTSHELSLKHLESVWDFYTRSYKSQQGTKGPSARKRETIEGGNYRLIEALEKSLKTEIIYNAALTALSKDTSAKYKLEFDGQTPILANKVVIAIPCTTLREVRIAPGLLPDDQLEAVQTLKYGNAAKVLLPVSLPEETPYSLARTEERSLTWLNNDKKVMTIWSTGPCAKSSTPQTLQTEQHSIAQLYPAVTFPTGTEMEPLKESFKPQYTKAVSINWAEEKYSKGCYSTLPKGQDHITQPTIPLHGHTIRRAFRPIENALFFAGEHVVPENFATLEGAALSGKIAAGLLNAKPA